MINIVKPGAIYGRWTLLESVKGENGKQIGWSCRCECGTVVLIKNVSTVINGKSKSCGCLRKEKLSADNPMYRKEVADKVSKSIRADPNRKEIIARAVVASQSEETKKKRMETNNIRYGGNSPSSSSSVTDKIAKTNLEKYGETAPAKNKVIRRKGTDTCIERYGVENIMYLPEYQKMISERVSKSLRDKGVTTLSDGVALVDACKINNRLPTSARNVARKYGIDVAEEWIKNYKGEMSGLELKLLDILNKDGEIAEIYNKQVKELAENDIKYKPDAILKDKNIFIDADGLYYHSRRDKNYHIEKAKAYADNNIRLFQFREDEILYKSDIVVSMIKSTLGLNQVIGARELVISEINQSAADEFMLNNHLMGVSSNAKNISLKKDGMPLMVMSYKKYKDGIDISRVATARGYTVTGGLSRLLAKIIEVNKPRFIQSFVDLRYASGHSLDKLGFKRMSVTLGWQWTDGKVTFNRLHCTANMDERCLSEKQYAKELGLVRIYDAGQAKYVKWIKETQNAQ